MQGGERGIDRGDQGLRGVIAGFNGYLNIVAIVEYSLGVALQIKEIATVVVVDGVPGVRNLKRI